MQNIKPEMAKTRKLNKITQREALEGRDPEAALVTASSIFGRYLGGVVRRLESRITRIETQLAQSQQNGA